MPRLPRASCGHARGECTCTVACGAPEPKTVSRPSSITVSWPTRMRLQQRHDEPAGDARGHRAGWGWTGTPLSFSATAWP